MRQSIRNQLFDEVRHNEQIHVVSGEDLSLLSSQEIVHLRDFFEPHYGEIVPIAYLRNPCHWALSMAFQWIRGGANEVKIPPTEYSKIAENWREVFSNSVQLLSYETAEKDFGGVPASFGAHFLGETVRNERENLSIPQPALGVIMLLNQRDLWPTASQINDGVAAGRHSLIKRLAGLNNVLDFQKIELPCQSYLRALSPREVEFSGEYANVTSDNQGLLPKSEQHAPVTLRQMGKDYSRALVNRGIESVPLYRAQLEGHSDLVSLSLLSLLRNL